MRRWMESAAADWVALAPAAGLDAAAWVASQGFPKAAASLVAAAVAGEGGTRGGVMVLLAELTRALLRKVPTQRDPHYLT